MFEKKMTDKIRNMVENGFEDSTHHSNENVRALKREIEGNKDIINLQDKLIKEKDETINLLKKHYGKNN